MAEIKHCLAVLVNKEGMRNNWRKEIPRRANFGQRRILSKNILSYKRFPSTVFFFSKKCKEISLPTSFKILISIILGTWLAYYWCSHLGGLRKEKILQNNKKLKLNKILFQEFNVSKELHWPAGSNCLSMRDSRTTEGK